MTMTWVATAEQRPDGPYLILMAYSLNSTLVKFGYLGFRLGVYKNARFYESAGLSWYEIEAPDAWIRVPAESFNQLFNVQEGFK